MSAEDVGEPEIAALELVGQLLVVHADLTKTQVPWPVLVHQIPTPMVIKAAIITARAM